MQRDLRAPLSAGFCSLALVIALASPGAGQSVATPAPPAGPVVSTPLPPQAPAPLPTSTPAAPCATPTPIVTPMPGVSVPPLEGPLPCLSPTPLPVITPVPSPSPTQAPIVLSPSSIEVVYHSTASVQASGASGQLAATSSNPSIVQVRSVDQQTQQITLSGDGLGIATVTVTDDRGVSASLWVRVAYQAGFPATSVRAKITGNPASADYVRSAAAAAAAAAAIGVRPGAKVLAHAGNVTGAHELALDDVETVQVPVRVMGDPYIHVSGVTQVRVENFAQPRIKPVSLLVSDYPETITQNGVLFSEDLAVNQPERFLYYHYNKPGSEDRRILLKLTNPGEQPVQVQYIAGATNPTPDVLAGGHVSTMRFLRHETLNEGSVITVPAKTTINLINQEFPAGTLVANLLQFRELNGSPLHLTLLVQGFDDPVDTLPASTALLQSTVKHARGVYPIPEFYFDYTYFVGQDNDLDIPIGRIPLPNLLRGEALGGDYGVLQSITVTMVNRSGVPGQLALYENPHGGAATASYIIDGKLVLSHPIRAFTKYKVRQYTVPAHGFVRTQITTMPEGGSSYPLYLIIAPDDGSVAPGAPGSPIY